MSVPSKQNRKTRTLRVPGLARVEGEGALYLTMQNGKPAEVRLDIYEPPRFFEAILRGRDFREVPDITARICGICPVAYQMGSCHALEKAMGAFDQIEQPIRDLRNLLYCGEWIESHVLHMFMLHLPDFLGYESAITMAADHGPIVKRALKLKKLGNDLVTLLAGRAVHPVGVCIGGFYKALDPEAAKAMLPSVRAATDDMCDLTLFLAEQVKFPDLERNYEFVSLCPDDEYPMNLGRIKSNKGLDVDQEEFGNVIQEEHAAHTNALRSIIKGRGSYMVGPLARLNLNAGNLHPRAADLLPHVCHAIEHDLPWNNSFYSLLARGIETVHALALSEDILRNYNGMSRSRARITPRAGSGGHGTEAPRGVCWHHYTTADDGTIASARIIPPTAQNQRIIEEDLRDLAAQIADLDDEPATLRCEHLIRNYDPCISCSVHFLRMERKNAS